MVNIAQYAQEMLSALPELNGQLAIADLSAGTYYGGLGQSALGSYPNAEVIAAYRDRTFDPAEGAWAISQPEKNIAILFYAHVVPATGDADKDFHLMVDHELGHIVTDRLMREQGTFEARKNDVHFRENAADAFASLMQIRRYGAEEGGAALETMAMKRAYNFFIINDLDHYTVPSLNEVAALKDDPGIAGLTVQQIAKVALRIAGRMALSPAEVQKTDADFRDLHPKAGETLDRSLNAIAEFIERDGTPEASFQAGMAILKPFAGNRLSINGRVMDFSGDGWKNTQQRLAKKAAGRKKKSSPSSASPARPS